MDNDDMEALLGFYKLGQVPSLTQLRLGEDNRVATFDGSFGFWPGFG